MATTVRNNPDRSRFELLDDDEVVGVADYRVGDDAVVMPHTQIDPSRRGEGLGAVLVRFALDELRRDGHTVVPRCWYVAEFIDANPEYQELLAS